jgi:hypothetical protein
MCGSEMQTFGVKHGGTYTKGSYHVQNVGGV